MMNPLEFSVESVWNTENLLFMVSIDIFYE